MAKRIEFSFHFWGFNSAQKTVEDAEREVRIFFKIGCTPADLLEDLNAYYRRNADECYRLLADKKGVPVALGIEDFTGCHVPAASALALSGNLRVLQHAVLRGADIHRGGKGQSCAIVAAAESCWARDDNASLPNRDALRRGFYADVVPMLRFLIEQGADINATDDEGKTALIHAAQVGHREAVEFLIEQGAHLSRQDQHGYNALHLAAVARQQGPVGRDGYCDVVGTVRTLLANGANPTDRNFFSHTVLHTMAARGEELGRREFDAVVRLLLDAGANLDARDRYGETPFLKAMRNERGAKVMIPGFVDAGADTEARTPQGSGAGRVGKEEAKRALKAALMAKNIGSAMGGDSSAAPTSGSKRGSLGML